MKKYNINITACVNELNTLSAMPSFEVIKKSFIIEAKDKEDAKQKGREKFIAETLYKGSIYGEYTGERRVAPFMEGFAEDHSAKYEDITRNEYFVYSWHINVFVKQYRKPRTKPEAEATAETTQTTETTEATAETTEATAQPAEVTEQPTETRTTEATTQTTRTEHPTETEQPTETRTTEATAQPTQTTEATAQPTEAENTEAMSITLTINMDENNELLETIKAYKIEVDFLRRMVAKALKAEAEARAEVRKLKQAKQPEEITNAEETEQPKAEATAQTTEETAQTTEATTETTEATAQPKYDYNTSYPTTEATAQTAEATPPPTEATAQTAEATPPPTEETAQPTGAIPPTGATPPPTEATGEEVTGVTIIEHRQYNNGDKVIIKHNCFYNADEIIDNYHATDPSYICKYKGLMFGKDDNDYYVSEFHHEEQYL